MRKFRLFFLITMLMAVIGSSGCSNRIDVPGQEPETISTEVSETEESLQSQPMEAVPEASTEADIVEMQENKDKDESQEEEKNGHIISITMAEMEEKLANKESFLISFVTTVCPYCHDFHDLLVDYIQENEVTMYQVILDYEETSEEENRRLVKEQFEEFDTVPAVFYVKDGENASYLDFYNLGISTEVFDEWIHELGLK